MNRIQELIAEAEQFSFDWPFVPIRSFKFDRDFRGGLWVPSGEFADAVADVTVSLDCDDFCVTHEVFHSAFHNSPLWGKCEGWGDAFCNTFAHFKAKNRRDFSNRSEHYLKNYVEPSQRILEMCRGDYDVFQLFWRIHQRMAMEPWTSKNFLNGILRYQPGVGPLK